MSIGKKPGHMKVRNEADGASNAIGSPMRGLEATEEQSDTRRLVTASQRFVPGLPRSDSRRPSQVRSRSRDEGSHVRASRHLSGAKQEYMAFGTAPDSVGVYTASGQAAVVCTQPQLTAPSDLTDTTRLTAAELAGHQPPVSHQLLVLPEAVQIAQLSHQRSGDLVDQQRGPRIAQRGDSVLCSSLTLGPQVFTNLAAALSASVTAMESL